MALDINTIVSALEAQVASQASSGVSSYSIGNRSVSRESLLDQIEALKELQLMQERQRSGGVFRKAAIRRPQP